MELDGDRSRVLEIDGLRCIAILSVLVWHYGAIPFPKLPPLVGDVLALGRSGVDLFFVLSGFLICGILRENKSAPNLFSVFYIRRALRIWPSYYTWFLSGGLRGISIFPKRPRLFRDGNIFSSCRTSA